MCMIIAIRCSHVTDIGKIESCVRLPSLAIIAVKCRMFNTINVKN